MTLVFFVLRFHSFSNQRHSEHFLTNVWIISNFHQSLSSIYNLHLVWWCDQCSRAQRTLESWESCAACATTWSSFCISRPSRPRWMEQWVIEPTLCLAWWRYTAIYSDSLRCSFGSHLAERAVWRGYTQREERNSKRSIPSLLDDESARFVARIKR